MTGRTAEAPDLVAALSAALPGAVRARSLDRLGSAHDASHYLLTPQALVVPSDVRDVARLLAVVAGGDYGMPDFVEFPLPWMESAQIVEIEQLSEFVFESAGPPEDGIVVGRADVELYLEGATFKGDAPWAVIDDERGLTIVGDLNDDYYDTATEIVATIDTSGGLGHYELQDIVLKEKSGLNEVPVDQVPDEQIV